jgi:hypothetical protein
MTRTRNAALCDLRDHLATLRTMVLDQIVRTGGPGEPPTDWNRLRAMLAAGANICAEGEKEDRGEHF